jgi:hypothetical protein
MDPLSMFSSQQVVKNDATTKSKAQRQKALKSTIGEFEVIK